jgi:hypothetical protein
VSTKTVTVVAFIIGICLVGAACWISLTATIASLTAVAHWFSQPDSVTGDKSWAIRNREVVFQSIVHGRLTASAILAATGIMLCLFGRRA